MAGQQPPSNPRFTHPRIVKNGVLSQRLPPELLQMILEYALVPPLALTVRSTTYQKFRYTKTAEEIDGGDGSCQAQLLRTCQELHELGLRVWFEKATFRLTAHCEGRHTTARTPSPFRGGRTDWLTSAYGGVAGHTLLSKFQRIELEFMPDWTGGDVNGHVVTWTSSAIMADSLRFLSQHFRGKDLTVAFAHVEGLKTDRVNLEELGMWVGMLELVRCKSVSIPQFQNYMDLYRHTGPLALCTSDEEIIDLDERRNDYLQRYFDYMNEYSIPNDQYYNSTLVGKIKERALQCNIKEYIYLRTLYSDRIDQMTNQQHERPTQDDERLLRIHYQYGQPQLEQPHSKDSSESMTDQDGPDGPDANTAATL